MAQDLIYGMVMENLLVNLFFPGNGAMANPGGSEGEAIPPSSGGESFFALLTDRMGDAGVSCGSLLGSLVSEVGLSRVFPMAVTIDPSVSRTAVAEDGQIPLPPPDSQALLDALLQFLDDSWSRIVVSVKDSGAGESPAGNREQGAVEQGGMEEISSSPGEDTLRALLAFVPPQLPVLPAEAPKTDAAGVGEEKGQKEEANTDPVLPEHIPSVLALAPKTRVMKFPPDLLNLTEPAVELVITPTGEESDDTSRENRTFFIVPTPFTGEPEEADRSLPEQGLVEGESGVYVSLPAFLAAQGLDQNASYPGTETQEPSMTGREIPVVDGDLVMKAKEDQVTVLGQGPATGTADAPLARGMVKDMVVQGQPEPIQRNTKKPAGKGIDPAAPEVVSMESELPDGPDKGIRVVSAPGAERFQVLYEKDGEAETVLGTEKGAKVDDEAAEFESMARDQYNRIAETRRAAPSAGTEKSAFAAMVIEKVDKVVEQFNTRGVTGDLVVRVKLDDNDTLLVGLKEQGKVVTVEIRTGNEGTYNLLQSSKETIERQLENRNIFANIHVDPDGQWAFERRERRQERDGQQGRRTEVQEEFGSILEALG